MGDVVDGNFGNRLNKQVISEELTSMETEIPKVSATVNELIQNRENTINHSQCYPIHEFEKFIKTEIPLIFVREKDVFNKDMIKELQGSIDRFDLNKLVDVENKKNILDNAEVYAWIIKFIFDTITHAQVEFSYEQDELEYAIDCLVGDDISSTLDRLWEERMNKKHNILPEEDLSFDEPGNDEDMDDIEENVFIDDSDIPKYNLDVISENVFEYIDELFEESGDILTQKYPQITVKEDNKNLQEFLNNVKADIIITSEFILNTFEYLASEIENPIKFDEQFVISTINERIKLRQKYLIEDIEKKYLST